MRKIYILFLLLSFCSVFLIGCDTDPDEVTKSIKSLTLDIDKTSETNGSFILGFGTVSSSSKLSTKYYIYIMGEEGYKLTELDSSQVEIVETDEIKPCAKITYYQDEYNTKYNDYVLYVPTGTITQEYKVTID